MFDMKNRDDIFLSEETTRRAFLKGLLILASATTFGTFLPGCGGYIEPPEGLRFLDKKRYNVMKAFAVRVLPPDGAFPEGAMDTGVLEFFDGFVATDYPEVQKDLKKAITLLEHGTLLLNFKFKRFTKLTVDEQDEYLRTWEDSRIALLRGAMIGLKRLCFMGFYTNEKVWPRIGYDGPWV